MKTYYSFFVCILCMISIAMGQVHDDFSDGNFTMNPEWAGDTADFEINSSGQLHLNSTGSDTSVLFTRSSGITDTEWDFWIKLSFNTSSNNNARIYLSADTPVFHSISTGYFLQVGGTDDSIFIMKQTGTSTEKIYRVKSYRTAHSTNTLRFKIRCDPSGYWEVMTDTTGGTNYMADGSFFNYSTVLSGWFGLMCRYTSSNATKFYFDDFYVGPILHDTVRPGVTSLEVRTAKEVRVGFSEAMQQPGVENCGNYTVLPPGLPPDSVIRDIQNPTMVSIFLHDSLPGRTTDSLRIRNISDLAGNLMADTTLQICYHQPKMFDILIDELLADPDPPVGLPDGEFVELYNRSMYPVNLQDWTFKYGSSVRVFPAITLPSKEFLLVVRDSAYLKMAKCAVLFTSSSSLSNEGTTLVLSDSRHHVIHSVTYSPRWYNGSFKEEGGWSLEMIDPSNPCGCAGNWGPSKDAAGGTPGRVNSVSKDNPDFDEPVAQRVVITDSVSLDVTFSEAMDSISLLARTTWNIHPDGEVYPDRVVPVPPGFSSVKLMFGKSFERGVIYNLKVTGDARDCAGNRSDTSRITRFAFPETPAVHDIVINEILSNPASGGSRFLELYNRSEKIIDLQALVVANRESPGELQSNAIPLTAYGYLLFPGEYAAFTSNREEIIYRYRPAFPEAIAEMNRFPVFGDDTGTVVLARKDDLGVIDRMRYDQEMHYPLLATAEGVSLERTNPDLPSDDKSNWHSAAETVGFATPGYRNSHWVEPEEISREVMVEPPVFSPDNDGQDDLLVVRIRLNEADYTANILVYDSRGRLVRQLANNILIGNEGVFNWDGMNETRCKAPLGLYVLLIELTRPDGTVKRVKKTAILGGKLQ